MTALFEIKMLNDTHRDEIVRFALAYQRRWGISPAFNPRGVWYGAFENGALHAVVCAIEIRSKKEMDILELFAHDTRLGKAAAINLIRYMDDLIPSGWTMLCTVVAENTPMIETLKRYGCEIATVVMRKEYK